MYIHGYYCACICIENKCMYMQGGGQFYAMLVNLELNLGLEFVQDHILKDPTITNVIIIFEMCVYLS